MRDQGNSADELRGAVRTGMRDATRASKVLLTLVDVKYRTGQDLPG